MYNAYRYYNSLYIAFIDLLQIILNSYSLQESTAQSINNILQSISLYSHILDMKYLYYFGFSQLTRMSFIHWDYKNMFDHIAYIFCNINIHVVKVSMFLRYCGKVFFVARSRNNKRICMLLL